MPLFSTLTIDQQVCNPTEWCCKSKISAIDDISKINVMNIKLNLNASFWQKNKYLLLLLQRKFTIFLYSICFKITWNLNISSIYFEYFQCPQNCSCSFLNRVWWGGSLIMVYFQWIFWSGPREYTSIRWNIQECKFHNKNESQLK